MPISPFIGNVCKPVAAKPMAWDAPLPDLRLLAIKILAQHKVTTARLEDINQALDNPQDQRSIEGGAYLMPPFCVWGLPRSDRGKGQQGGGDEPEAPRLWFLGAPLLGVKAAGLSHDFAESVAKADDPRWTAKAMQYIHHRGGFVYGGLWSTVRWAQGKGVDTSDFQRIAEYAMDQLAVQDPLHLTSFALGSEPARVQIKSLREAQRLITGIWSGEKGGAPAEEQKANKFLVLNRLAHPEFSILTTSHRGTTLEETLASFSLFSGVTRISGPRGAQGWELTLTPVAVALGIGMASRLGRLVSDGQKAFDPERVAVLLGWLNGLKESERRLARHLLLSPGDRDGYVYLKEPYYAAAVLGHRLSDDRRTRERIVSSLEESGLTILDALQSLDCLPAVQAHLVRALTSMGIGVEPRSMAVVAPGLGLDLEDTPTVPTATKARSRGSEVVRLPQMQDTTATNARTGLLQMRAPDCHKSATRLPQMQDTTAIKARHDGIQMPDSNSIYEPLITSSVFPEPFSIPIHPSASGSLPHYPDKKGYEDGLTDGSKDNPFLNNEEFQSDQTALITIDFPSGEKESEDPFQQTILLPPPSGNTLGRPENRLKKWPRPLFEAVAQKLSPVQMARLESECRWTAEGVWAIYQEILVKGARLNNPQGTLWNGLVRVEKGEVWLGAGPRLRQAGWMELPEDTTPLESVERRLSAGRLAPYRRLPLDEAGLIRREEILRDVAEKRRRATEPESQPGGSQGIPEGPGMEVWNRLAGALADLVPQRTFVDWILPCRPVSSANGQLVLHVGSRDNKRWIEDQMMDEFYEAMDLCGLGDLKLRFVSEE